jgi:hypothetical protein
MFMLPSMPTTAAGNPQPYTAEGRDQYDNSLGDVTAGTTFSIGPNGSCTGANCTATLAGSHTVTGSDGGKTGTATLGVTAGALDHLALSPASAVIVFRAPSIFRMRVMRDMLTMVPSEAAQGVSE